MVSLKELHSVRYQKIQHSCIGDVLTTMRALGEQHFLVTNETKNLRRIISAVDISRAFHISLDISATVHNFKDVFDVVHDHSELN